MAGRGNDETVREDSLETVKISFLKQLVTGQLSRYPRSKYSNEKIYHFHTERSIQKNAYGKRSQRDKIKMYKKIFQVHIYTSAGSRGQYRPAFFKNNYLKNSCSSSTE